MRKVELEYYDYIEYNYKFYCCKAIFPSNVVFKYEYSPHLQVVRFKHEKKSKILTEKTIFGIKPDVSRTIIIVDIFLKATKIKIDQNKVSQQGKHIRDFFNESFTYVRGIKEQDDLIKRKITKFYENPEDFNDEELNVENYGIIIDLIKCGGIKC